jgi:plasmid stabilization system protein ParE
MTFRILVEASEELDAAAGFYATRRQEVAVRFLDDVEFSINRLLVDPESWPVVDGDFRRSPLVKFPYDIVFRVTEEGVVVFAVAHRHRRPGYWKRRSDSESEA